MVGKTGQDDAPEIEATQALHDGIARAKALVVETKRRVRRQAEPPQTKPPNPAS